MGIAAGACLDLPARARFRRLGWLALVGLGMADVGGAAVSVPLGQIDVGAPIEDLRATPDGHRVLLVVASTSGSPAGVRVIDTSRPDKPAVKGFLALAPGVRHRIALAPNGRTALVTTEVEPSKYRTATPYDIRFVDLSDPISLKEVWRRRVVSRYLSLAENASGYAVSQDNGDKDFPWDTVIKWVDPGRANTVIEKDTPTTVALSEQGQYLLQPDAGEFVLADLRPAKPILYRQEWGELPQSRYSCATVRDDGTMLAADQRASRIGLYAARAGLPRIAVINKGAGPELCPRLNANGDVSDVLFRLDSMVVRLNLRDPVHPTLDGYWDVPILHARAVAGSLLIATEDDRARANLVHFLRLEGASRSSIDWPSLEQQYLKALQHYKDIAKSGRNATEETLSVLERAGVFNALDAQVTGIPEVRGAAILSDYGFWSGKMGEDPLRSIVGEMALRRAIVLDPARNIAKLNLADLLQARQSTVWAQPGKLARATEIDDLYRDYQKAGGKVPRSTSAALSASRRTDRGEDFCGAIAEYANAGHLDEIMGDTGVDVPAGVRPENAKRKLDIFFYSEGSGHFPAIHAFESDTDFPVKGGSLTIPGGEALGSRDNLGLLQRWGKAHILYYSDTHHPVASGTPAGDETCQFHSEFDETVGPNSTEPDLCRSLSKGDGPESLEFATSSKLDAVAVADRFDFSYPESTAVLDVFNDGQPVTIVKMEIASGAGPGCTATFYDMLNVNGEELASGSKRDLFMQLQGADTDTQQVRYPVSCGVVVRLFRHNGTIFAESRAAEWPPTNDSDVAHRVARIVHGKAVDVCDFRFQTSVSPGQ
jgi:hypothetical protein